MKQIKVDPVAPTKANTNSKLLMVRAQPYVNRLRTNDNVTNLRSENGTPQGELADFRAQQSRIISQDDVTLHVVAKLQIAHDPYKDKEATRDPVSRQDHQVQVVLVLNLVDDSANVLSSGEGKDHDRETSQDLRKGARGEILDVSLCEREIVQQSVRHHQHHQVHNAEQTDQRSDLQRVQLPETDQGRGNEQRQQNHLGSRDGIVQQLRQQVPNKDQI
ncbi:hypothetical protein WICPIJ_002461 [Wickerhamomyces pijperi]|uniref:Uncharacterized protein n=1 Tax=Wickerhamomyces pijperi TaxID=599730 RepID=A0A9P8Q9L8_WICPI|nr:hypothetical protein WICPIJ_002461 [Wickerhamomyces pijperi]